MRRSELARRSIFKEEQARLAADREIEQAMAGKALVDHPFALFEFMAETWVVNPLLTEFWTLLPADSPVLLAGEQRFFALAARGLPEAKAAGRIRADFSSEDFCLIGMMLRAIRHGADEAERRCNKERVLTLLREGMVP